ncbi:MAG: hypothetical protein HDR00_10750 [Lachnospiraceae bacterium]|nr:hypothetical protein [Lachnospiraceae bacterium]
MHNQIDELLKTNEYDIYHNPNVSDEGIIKIAELIAADKSIDLKELFDFVKCSSKFCWLNFLNILEKLPKEDKVRGLPVLFVLLQDSNWPTFQKTMDLFATIDTKTVKSHLDKYLVQACAEDDEMWLSNLHLLAKNLK